ncbi:MAG: hypothetical protein ACI4BH_05410 [Muribaculaceae bacterium]
MGKGKTAQYVEAPMVNLLPQIVSQEVVESEGYCLTPRGLSSVVTRVIKSTFGSWMRHKVRAVIVKQWKKFGTNYKIKKVTASNIKDTSLYQAAMTRLGWYRLCVIPTFTLLQ